MKYIHALEYLDGFVNFERSQPTRATRAVITLDRVIELASRLGNPQDRFKSIHVAGTKGKGSTSAFTASILRAAGLKTGLYVSPHLQDVRERISINGTMIPEEAFARILDACAPTLEEMRHPPQGQRRPTYFEVLTHLAFTWFAEEKVDAAVIEVGLGGRLDATNIIKPTVCGITNISFDHVAILGDTLDAIAREKAGIMKPGVPVVIAPQAELARSALADAAVAVGAPAEFVGREILLEAGAKAGRRGDGETGGDLPHWPPLTGSVTFPDGSSHQATLGLKGRHQLENWAVAVRLADLFHRAVKNAPVPTAAVQSGSASVVWPGRLEEVVTREGTRLYLDGAHNDHSVKTVLGQLAENLPGAPLVVLFACAKDKDAAAMLKVLAAAPIDNVIFTHSGNTRSRDPQELLAQWKEIASRDAVAIESCSEALQKAVDIAGRTKVVLVTGSLYLVGAVKDALEK